MIQILPSLFEWFLYDSVGGKPSRGLLFQGLVGCRTGSCLRDRIFASGPCLLFEREMEDIVPSEFEVNIPTEEVLFINLQILGFQQAEFPKDFQIQLTRDLFRKSNQKALESILLFLFSRILTMDQMTAFTFCWPPRTHEMKREFKEESYKMIHQLENEGRVPKGTLVGKAILDTAQGERVLSFLRTMSEVAIMTRLKQDLPWKVLPRIQVLEEYLQRPSNANRNVIYRIKKALLVHIRRQIHQFNESARRSVISQKQWVAHAEDLSKMHGKLRNSIDQYNKQIGEVSEQQLLIERMASLDRAPQIDMVRYIWRNIQTIDEQSLERHGNYTMQSMNTLQQESLDLDQDSLQQSSDSISDSTSNIKLDEVVRKWGTNLKEVTELINKRAKERDHMKTDNPTLALTQQLRSIIQQYKTSHQAQLELLRKTNASLQEQIGKTKLSTASHEYFSRTHQCYKYVYQNTTQLQESLNQPSATRIGGPYYLE